MRGRATRLWSLKIPSLARRAGVCGFMVTWGVFNTSPKRERGDPRRGDLSVGHFGGVGDPRRKRRGFRRGPTTPFGGRAIGSMFFSVNLRFRSLIFVSGPVFRLLFPSHLMTLACYERPQREVG